MLPTRSVASPGLLALPVELMAPVRSDFQRAGISVRAGGAANALPQPDRQRAGVAHRDVECSMSGA